MTDSKKKEDSFQALSERVESPVKFFYCFYMRSRSIWLWTKASPVKLLNYNLLACIWQHIAQNCSTFLLLIFFYSRVALSLHTANLARKSGSKEEKELRLFVLDTLYPLCALFPLVGFFTSCHHKSAHSTYSNRLRRWFFKKLFVCALCCFARRTCTIHTECGCYLLAWCLPAISVGAVARVPIFLVLNFFTPFILTLGRRRALYDFHLKLKHSEQFIGKSLKWLNEKASNEITEESHSHSPRFDHWQIFLLSHTTLSHTHFLYSVDFIFSNHFCQLFSHFSN